MIVTRFWSIRLFEINNYKLRLSQVYAEENK